MSTEKRHLIVGTSGHIDHGKTALIKAMTGVDADTLQEEKDRGITIELGFVFMETPDPDCEVLFIDVPGHEKLVKTMVAGASNIDAALLVVAADDGVNLQTREHFDILRFLDIPEGVIALNKSDLTDDRGLGQRTEEIRAMVAGSFLEGAPVIPVSAVTGAGVEAVRSALLDIAGRVRTRTDTGVFRMPIDRVFTMQGFGTVVAGTILSGSLQVQDEVEVYPEGIVAKVRGVQVHGETSSRSTIGKRTAVNLLNVPKEKLRRGQCLGFPGSLTPTGRLDARFTLLPSTRELKNLSRLRFYTGTSEVLCKVAVLDRDRIRAGETAPVQFILEKPVMAMPGDRFVIRTLSPLYTLGGGVVIDTQPVKHKRFDEEMLEGLNRLDGGLDELVAHNVYKSDQIALELPAIVRGTGKSEEDTRSALDRLTAAGILRVHLDGSTVRYLHREHYELLSDELLDQATRYLDNHPGELTVPLNHLQSRLLQRTDRPTFRFIMKDAEEKGRLVREGTEVTVRRYRVRLDPAEQQLAHRVEQILLDAGITSPLEKQIADTVGVSEKKMQKIIAALIFLGKAARLSDKVTYHRRTVDDVTGIVLNLIREHGRVSIAALRTELGVSRKYSQAILEHLNRTGVTKREGDEHVLS